MVRDETMYYSSSPHAPKLDSRYQLLFGTETTYLFLRLYLLLCSLLSDIQDHVAKHQPLDDPADNYVTKTNTIISRKKKSRKLNYSSILVSMKKVMKNEMNLRDFEALARKISREKVHQIAALPSLLDRCVERLVKVAEEDTLLQLYDYCHGLNVDPIAVRSQCLAVAPDAFYRIQMDSTSSNIRFCYLESDPLLVYPPNDDDENALGDTGVNAGDEMDDDDMDTGDDAGVDVDQMDDGDDPTHQPDTKRARLA